MKGPPIPTAPSWPAEPALRALALVAILLAAAMCACLSEASPQVMPSAILGRCHRRAHHPLVRKTPAGARPSPPSWCIHLARNLPRHPPPPPQAAEEVDPVYGDEKRLVPSGPNPLHN